MHKKFKIFHLVYDLLFKKLKLALTQFFLFLFCYYILSFAVAFFDALSILGIISIFAFSPDSKYLSVLNFFGWSVSSSSHEIIFSVILLLFFTLIVKVFLAIIEYIASSYLREKFQLKTLSNSINSVVIIDKKNSVGKLSGIITQEAVIVSKYVVTFFSSINNFISAIVILLVAINTNFQLTFYLLIICAPIFFLMRYVSLVQSNFSKLMTTSRSNFSTFVTERLFGIVEIHVKNIGEGQLNLSKILQKIVTKYEIYIGVCQTIIRSFNVIVPLISLIFLYLGIHFSLINLNSITSFATIALLGLKIVSQFNGFLSGLGDLSRLSGSIEPVYEILNLRQKPFKEFVPEKIISLELNNITFKHDNLFLLKNKTFNISPGNPLILQGKSGSGKTTIANLIAGIYFPEKGSIFFTGSSGKKYSLDQYKLRIGYVLQDTFLFSGTLRDSLSDGFSYSDKKIWSALKDVGAYNFVKKLKGGLDYKIGESGIGLSGGQARKLAIAKSLLLDPDVYIFDEIFVGLDEASINILSKLIKKIFKKKIVVFISHRSLK